MHAQVREEAMDVADLALAAEKPRDATPMIFEDMAPYSILWLPVQD